MGNYVEAANAALVLDYGGVVGTQAVVAGLNTLKLPGSTRSEIEVKEFRQTSRKFAGSASRSNCEFSGNAVFDDAGQLELRRLYRANAKFGAVGDTTNGECRIYLNKSTSTDHFLDSDFMAPDTATDSISQFQIAGHDFPSTDTDGMFPYTGGIMPLGDVAIFTAHITGTGIASVDSDPDTITDTGSGFVTAGFQVGMVIIVEGSTAWDGIYGPLTAVAAGSMTVATGDALTAEAASASITIHGGFTY